MPVTFNWRPFCACRCKKSLQFGVHIRAILGNSEVGPWPKNGLQLSTDGFMRKLHAVDCAAVYL